MIKKIFIQILIFISLFGFIYSTSFAEKTWEEKANEYLSEDNLTDDEYMPIAWTIEAWIVNGVQGTNTVINNVNWKKWVEELFKYTKNTIFDLLALIVIWVFLYIWYKIVISRWNPEEFKKAFMMLIYTVLWMLFVALAWVIVVFISGLKI